MYFSFKRNIYGVYFSFKRNIYGVYFSFERNLIKILIILKNILFKPPKLKFLFIQNMKHSDRWISNVRTFKTKYEKLRVYGKSDLSFKGGKFFQRLK